MTSFVVKNVGALHGTLLVPGDKSISHRAIMLGALAEGSTRVTGLLQGEDVMATLAAFRAMGVRAEGIDNGDLVLHGIGMRGLQAPKQALDMGNSGTAMRLLTGLLSAQSFNSTLIGDTSLNQRPMARVITPLQIMGAKIDSAEKGTPPLYIHGGCALHGIEYDMPMASAQVKSALLLAGLYAEGSTAVTEPAPTRDHTERMLSRFGYDVDKQGTTIRITGGGRLQSRDIAVPADISSAAFFIVGALIAPGSEIRLSHVGINPTRIGVINILRQMGAAIHLENEIEVGGEPVADLIVKHSNLNGIKVAKEQVPLAIDELPILFIAAACAKGYTEIHGAEELRLKESDRIAVMVAGLSRLGVVVEELADGMIIKGSDIQGGTVDSFDDHRIAMSFAIAGLVAQQPIRIQHCGNVATSFPNFVDLATSVGVTIDIEAD